MKIEDKLADLRKLLMVEIKKSGIMIERIEICYERIEFTYWKDMKQYKYFINNY